MRQTIFIEQDDELVTDAVHEDVRAHIGGLAAVEAGTGQGLQGLDDVQVLAQAFHIQLELAQQGLVAVGFQIFQMRLHQFQQDGVTVVAQALQLHQQTFAGIPGRHAHRVEKLYALQHGLHGLRRGGRHLGDLFHAGPQIARRTQVADDDLADLLLLVRQGRKMQLPEQMAFQRGLGRVTGLQGRDLFRDLQFPPLRGARRAGELAEIFLPVGIAGKVFVIDFVLGLLVPRLLLILRSHGLIGRGLFQEGVLQQFLLDGLQKFDTRKLQQLDGLLQLGGHDQLLRQFELLTKFQCHGVLSCQ